MITIRKSSERGHANHGWLDSHHSFSFADYYDPAHMGLGSLRVINEDHVATGRGFGTQSHQTMEIISYVLSGELAHKDSMGNVKGIPPGDVQRTSAGTGVQISESNHAEGQTTHFLQIWILPNVKGILPSSKRKTFSAEQKRGKLRLVMSPDGTDGSVLVHADARMYAGLFDGTEAAKLTLDSAQKCDVHVVSGELDVNRMRLSEGDAVALEGESLLDVGGEAAEVLVFDLAPL